MHKTAIGICFLLTASFLYCSNKTEQRDGIVGYRASILKDWKTDLKIGVQAGGFAGAIVSAFIIGSCDQTVLAVIKGGLFWRCYWGC